MNSNNDVNTSTQAGKRYCSKPTLAPLVRESQSLQLCALHSMNNLLQLRPIHNGGDGEESLILCGGNLYRHSKIRAGSKAEFDAIADELTFKEAQWYSQDKSDGESNQISEERKVANENENHGRHLSYWQLLRSHHRTLVTGNYSFEVLEAALSKRNVNLEWCAQIDESIFSNDEDSKNDEPAVTIGFIINAVAPLSITNAFTRVLATPRHWFIITKLRRVVKFETTGAQLDKNDVRNCNEVMDYDSNTWHLVNSSTKAIWNMSSEELEKFLLDIKKDENASIIRAVMQKLVPMVKSRC